MLGSKRQGYLAIGWGDAGRSSWVKVDQDLASLFNLLVGGVRLYIGRGVLAGPCQQVAVHAESAMVGCHGPLTGTASSAPGHGGTVVITKVRASFPNVRN